MRNLMKLRWRVAFLPFLALLPIVALAQGRGGGGGGGGTPLPPSAIYYTYQGALWQVDQSGQHTVALSSAATDWLRTQDDSGLVQPVPSGRLYNGQRLYLWMGAREDNAHYFDDPNKVRIREFYVGVPSVWGVRLTDLWGDDQLMPETDVYAIACWSGDHNDQFISLIAHDRYPGGTSQTYIVRIPFDVNAVLSGDATAIAVAWASRITIEIPNYTLWHRWSPDNQTVLYHHNEQVGSSTWQAHFYRYRLGDSQSTLVWTDNLYTLGAEYTPQWSPDLDPNTAGYQGRIAFSRMGTVGSIERQILTIPAEAQGLVGVQGATVVLTAKGHAYFQPHWEPSNGSQLAIRDRTIKGSDSSKWPYNILRLNLGTGSTTNLTGNLDQLSQKMIVEWRPVP